MDKSRANILQIQKYLNGELDAKAMHKLEREAQDDPFLMDALEGYQSSGNQQANLNILAGLLDARVNKKERRIIPWMTISIAAGVIGFMVVVGLLYKGSNNPVEPQIAQTVAPATTSKPDTVQTVTPPVTTDKQVEVAALQPAKPIQKITNHATADGGRMQAKPTNASVLALADTMRGDVLKKTPGDGMPLDEVVMNTIAIQRDTVEMPLTVAVAKRSISQTLEGKVAGVSTSEVKKPASGYELAKLGIPTQYVTPVVPKDKVIPPGAIGTAYTKPESSNDYKIIGNAEQIGGKNEPGLIAFGNASKAVNTNLSNNLNTNANFLRADTQAGYDYSKSDVLKPNALAHPEKGWVMYQLYLSQKCTVPAGQKAGKVELKFTVSPTGDISNIVVTKSLSTLADKKAIQIINEGPKWAGNANGKPEEKTLQLEFVNK
ncbi:energy transducer TonB [Mucilaginibacter pedocola]|uniref:TonB C-terminal domain-containing protein n=1 Tax=Mucilaginibacter pedocola TaxID=1792845 RepID=A0A1S9PDQ9_9SPHI|nr:energy transducer TonB [Mucilaginibacter pedocola]OOQ59093.1 hypothetical protein BC343_29150 [Mucilaginibacter pedocola]